MEYKDILDNHTTSLIYDGNDETDDMEETNDVIPANKGNFWQV